MQDITSATIKDIDISDEDIQIDEPLFGVITYLYLIKKYPEARVDILELRRQKNKAMYISFILIALISGLTGYLIAMYCLVMI